MAKKPTLLDVAKSIEVDRRQLSISEEEVELALAWLSGDVTLKQVAGALGFKNAGAAPSRIAIVLREAYRAGMLKKV